MKLNRVLLTSALALLLALTGLLPVVAQDNPLVIWADAERAPLLSELGQQFEEEFGIPVEVQQYGLGDARDQLLIAGPAGEGPDIMVTAHDSIGQYVANGAIVPIELDEDMNELFTESSLDLFTYQGQLWGIPYAQENVALIRNVDLVPDAPQTWQDVREIAEQLQESGDAQYAFLVQTGNTYHNFPIFSGFGAYIFGVNEDGSFNVSDIGLNSEGALAASEWLSGMYNDGLMTPDVDDDVAFELFTSGAAAMIVTGPWFSARIAEAAEAGGFEYSVDPMPVAEGGSEVSQPFAGGQGFVISAFSDQPLEAETFLLDFVASADFMQAIFDQGGRPPAFVDVDTSADPNVELFNIAGENAIPMPAIPEMGAVWGATDAALTSISLGEDPTVAMNTAAEGVINAIGLMASDERLVTLVGSLQDEAGCAADWAPDCDASALTDEDGDGVFEGTFALPAGEYEYKIAINKSWAENYGVDGEMDGGNIALVLAEDTEVTFTYDDNTNLITDSVNN